jgi:hypothetical protein
VVSYYFNVFKKFQVFDHVPTSTVHGAAGGHSGFDLNKPDVLITPSAHGAPLGPNTLANCPVYQSLLARSNGAIVPGVVVVNGVNWPIMPGQITPAWTDLEVTPKSLLQPAALDAFATWFNAGHANDTPAPVLLLKPPTIPVNQLGGPETVFVCSYPGDVGLRPLVNNPVPANFWATSLIYLTDKATGQIPVVTELAPGAAYNLVAVIGSRYTDDIGKYMYGGSTTKTVQAQAWVMVWNAGMGPGVQLPALSNLDPASASGLYDQYFLRKGEYDLVGFDLDVQRTFDGLVEAVLAAGMFGNAADAKAWLTSAATGAHLCAKVVVARTGGPLPDAWPGAGELPSDNPRIAQKNLAPFSVALDESAIPDPNIVFKSFAFGDPLQMLAMRGDERWGRTQLVVRGEYEAGVKLYLAAPREVVKQWFPRAAQRLMRRMDELGEKFKTPFRDAVIFELPGKELLLELPRLGNTMLPLALGIQYSKKRLKAGRFGTVEVAARTAVPELLPGKECCYELVNKTTGGFTLELVAYDPRDVGRHHRGGKPGAPTAKPGAKSPGKRATKTAAKRKR